MTKIELEGRLRVARHGYDGYEYPGSNLYLDDAALMGAIDLPLCGAILAEGHNWVADFTEPQRAIDEINAGREERDKYKPRIDLRADYGRVRITIEQLPPDKSPEAVAKRVVDRHRGALDILEEIG